MAAIIVDGKPHRMRRGKLVEIPQQWLGRITTQKTIRDREKARVEKRCGRKRALRTTGPDAAEWD